MHASIHLLLFFCLYLFIKFFFFFFLRLPRTVWFESAVFQRFWKSDVYEAMADQWIAPSGEVLTFFFFVFSFFIFHITGRFLFPIYSSFHLQYLNIYRYCTRTFLFFFFIFNLCFFLRRRIPVNLRVSFFFFYFLVVAIICTIRVFADNKKRKWKKEENFWFFNR